MAATSSGYFAIPVRIRRLFSVLGIFIVWELLGEVVAPGLFASFSESLIGVVWLANNQELFQNVVLSASRGVIGFVVSCVLGISIGLAMGWRKRIDNVVQPLVSVFYPIPKIVFIPLTILWLGVTNNAILSLAIFSATFPVLLNTYEGARGVDQKQIWAARSLGASETGILRQVVLNNTLPNIFTGMRLTMGLTWIMVFAMEIIFSGLGGIGGLLILGKTTLRYDVVFSSLMIMAVIGYTADRLIVYNFERVCDWYFAKGEGAEI